MTDARALLADLRALAEKWERDSNNSHDEPCHDHDDCSRCCARDLRDLIAKHEAKPE